MAEDTQNYGEMTPEELRELCAQRRIPFGPNTGKRQLVQALKNDDKEQERLQGLRLVAEDLRVPLPEYVSRPAAQKLLDPVALRVLTQEGYFVAGGRGTPYRLDGVEWTLMGQQTAAGGFIKLSTQRVRGGPGAHSTIGPTQVYQCVHFPHTIVPTDNRSW